MKKNKRSINGLVLTLLTIALLVAVYFFFPGLLHISGTGTSTPAPTVLVEVTPSGVIPSVSIGHPIKTTSCKSDGVLPDPECTPGAIDPNVTQALAKGTICVSGYSGSVRPDTSLTNKIKVMQLQAYGFPNVMSDYELDHLISLELGGCADCVANLWPEPYNIPMGAHQKDKVENYLHKAVCNGEMTLEEAQKEIATDWTEVYYRVYGK